MPDSTKLLEALAALLWPVIIGVLLWRIFPAIRSIVSSRNFSVKVGSVELSVQDATEQIRTQIEDLQKQVILLRAERGERKAQPAAAAVLAGRPPSKRILWVDDKPSNNAIEIAQLVNEGVDVEQVASTEEAMTALRSGADFAAVVSDMGRFEKGRFVEEAGLTLLDAIRKVEPNLPVVVYTSKRSVARYNDRVRDAGGEGATASPVVLIEWIHKALG